MKQEERTISAIDIGTTKIVAIIGKKDEYGKLEVLGLGKSPSHGVKRGVVQNIEDTSNAIQTAVEQAEEQAGVKMKEVFVGIAGQHVRSLKNSDTKFITSSGNEITQQDVDELIKNMYNIPLEAGEDIIHVIPQSYTVDNESPIRKPVGMYGKKLEGNFHIVIGQIASARNIKRCVERAGLHVKSLMLEPLASSDAVLTADEKEAGVVLVDIGGGTTDLAVFYDGVIYHSAVVPLGGDLVTKDIKEGCSILLRHAEQLKIRWGCALAEMAPADKVAEIPGISGRDPKQIPFNKISTIIQARMEEIIDAFLFEIENTNIYHKLSAGIALTGGGSLLKHLKHLVKFKTGLDVRVAFPNRLLSRQADEKFNQPIYSTAIGLVLKGFEYYNQNAPAYAHEGNDEFDNEGADDGSKKIGDGFIRSIKDNIKKFFDDAEQDTDL